MRKSTRKQRIERRIGEIKKDKLSRMGVRCFLSDRWNMLQAAHIVRQSHSVALQDNERNIIILNHYIHEMFDNNQFKELYERYRWRCEAIIDRMYSLDHFYTNRFLRRNNLEQLIR
jgi:hypothetical protein